MVSTDPKPAIKDFLSRVNMGLKNEDVYKTKPSDVLDVMKAVMFASPEVALEYVLYCDAVERGSASESYFISEKSKYPALMHRSLEAAFNGALQQFIPFTKKALEQFIVYEKPPRYKFVKNSMESLGNSRQMGNYLYNAIMKSDIDVEKTSMLDIFKGSSEEADHFNDAINTWTTLFPNLTTDKHATVNRLFKHVGPKPLFMGINALKQNDKDGFVKSQQLYSDGLFKNGYVEDYFYDFFYVETITGLSIIQHLFVN